jgi:hypothetical protein
LSLAAPTAAQHLLFQFALVERLHLERLLGRLLGELDDRLDDRLEMPVAEHHGAQHDVLVELLGFRFHHQHGIRGAGDDEVELGVAHLVERGIEHIFVVDEADAGSADRPAERHARQRQRGRGRDHRQHVGIVLHVVRERGDDDLGLVAPAVDEQRADRAIDQAGDQRLLFGRPAFALEIAAGDAARGIGLFLVIDGQRQEVDALARRLRRDHGRQHDRLAVARDDGAAGLTRDLAGFKPERTAAPIDFD